MKNIIGYCMFNHTNGKVVNVDEGLLILSKPKAIEFEKRYENYTPLKLSAGEVIAMLMHYNQLVTFDFDSLQAFLKVVKEKDADFYNQSLADLESWNPSSEHQVLTLGL